MKNHRIWALMPSKKFTVAIILILVIGAGWFLVFGPKTFSSENGKSSGEQKRIAGILAKKDAIADGITKDSDNDGLSDWEEQLWGTDISKMDTDEDGYSDKEETDGGYDPLGIESNPKTGVKKAKTEITYDDSTATSTFSAKNFFNDTGNLTTAMARSLSLGSAVGLENLNKDYASGFKNSNNETKSALENFVAELNPVVTDKDIKISNDTSMKAAYAYFASTTAMETKGFPLQQPAMDAIGEILENKNTAKADEYIKYFSTTAEGFKKVVVPSTLAVIHKKKIAIYMALETIFESLKNLESDPMKTLLAVKKLDEINKESGLVAQEVLKIISSFAKK